MMANATVSMGVPPLPSYSTDPLPPLIAPIPDKFLTVILPVIAYWAFSLFFHFLDTHDHLLQYRLHTPAELLKRNHVSKRDVIRDVLVQQAIQTVIGILLGMTEPDDVIGRENYEVAVWATRIRTAQRWIPVVLSFVGLNAAGLAQHVGGSYPVLSGFLSGGNYPWLKQTLFLTTGQTAIVPAFAPWEILVAKAAYWFVIPAAQFALAIFVLDTWQYFLHRAMHTNLWLYRTFHSRHHRLYVPYAFGALYNHPFEGFLLDTLGASIAFKLAGLTTRQGMWFFTCSTLKTVDDHGGYALPFDPLQLITSNNAAYHDIHHQSWGIKTNFSQPFFTFWDRMLGTIWAGGDVSVRYERSKKSAQRLLNQQNLSSSTTNTPTESNFDDDGSYQDEVGKAIGQPTSLQESLPASTLSGNASQQAEDSRKQVLQDREGGGPQVLLEEAEEEKEARIALRRSPRKKVATTTPSEVGSLKGLTERVNGSLHGRSAGMLGLESSR